MWSNVEAGLEPLRLEADKALTVADGAATVRPPFLEGFHFSRTEVSKVSFYIVVSMTCVQTSPAVSEMTNALEGDKAISCEHKGQ